MAGKLDLTIEKGSTFERVFTWQTKDTETGQLTPVNLAGYKARCMFREVIDDPVPFLTLTTENGRIIIEDLTGIIRFNIPADVSAAVIPERGVWDLELYTSDGAFVIRLLEGKVKLKPEVTR